jgi:hypothetical protein
VDLPAAAPSPWPLALACLAAFCAGLVDAMAGGGGLIQLPAVLALMPGAPPAMALGTNKAASIWGTAVALLRYRGALQPALALDQRGGGRRLRGQRGGRGPGRPAAAWRFSTAGRAGAGLGGGFCLLSP